MYYHYSPFGNDLEDEVEEEPSKESIDLNMSRDPSYSKLEIPYDSKCRIRAWQKVRAKRKFFWKQVEEINMVQSKALHQVRFARVFKNPIIKMPQPIKLTPKEEARLDRLLNS